ncbi:MAG: dioxygenase [Hyphomicrobiaceae bacterium]
MASKESNGKQAAMSASSFKDHGGSADIPELTTESITDAVLGQMAQTPDPRLKEVMDAAVRHLHNFAREVNLTPAEWLLAIEFLTKVGQKCTPDRQEFILLSDTMGLSALVHFMHDKTAMEDATHSSLLGPFFRENAPRYDAGDQIARDVSAGEVALWGKVTNVSGEPVAGAEIGIWQTASNGLYDIQYDADNMDCRGIFTTDDNGIYLIRTVKPMGYSIPMDGPVGNLVKAQARHGMRPAHIHMLINATGYRELVTALYVDGDPHLADDTVFGTSGDLVAQITTDHPDCPIPGMPSCQFDFVLSREGAADRALGRVGADPAAVARA